ncbi:MAG TPA: hypothetical protein VI542_05770 [Candidatus Tectomicrobia bacterium]
MQTLRRIAVVTSALVVMLMADVPLLPVHLVPEAHAILGTRRRTAVVVGATVHAADSAQIAQAQQQTAAAQQEATAAKQEAAAAKQQAAAAATPPPSAAGKPLPLGTVVAALPPGCVATPVGAESYYYCGGNFYRAVFQGNQLMYVTTQPK